MTVAPCDVDEATCEGCVCERSLYCKTSRKKKNVLTAESYVAMTNKKKMKQKCSSC